MIDMERVWERVVKFLEIGSMQGELSPGPIAVDQRKLGRPM